MIDPDVATTATRAPVLSFSGRRLYRRGVPHQVFSGALHYFRVHPDLWADRIRRLADLGLNTVDTYVPWNFHQPHEGVAPRFDGWRDLERFLGLVADEGLDAIVRPGPYICAEWSNGGLPSWLTARGVVIRSSDPGFTEPVAGWFAVLLPRIAALQARQGGPVVAVQVENEYGSYGDDESYLRWNRDLLTRHGIGEMLFTADGPSILMQDGGTLPDTLAAVTLGSGPQAARELLASRRPDEPFLVAEFWNGWFDHWGEKHHTRSVGSAVETLRGIVADGGSVSLYMAHGGTNFGLWAGANQEAGRLQPTISSYDSDAPIAENGSLTPKFFAVREQLGANGPLRIPMRPPVLPARTVPLISRSGLLAALRAGSTVGLPSIGPASFERLGLDAGMVLHQAFPQIPPGEHTLTLTDVRDRALVFADGRLVGTADTQQPTLTLPGTGARVRLEIVVENLGRINYGQGIGGHKGLLGPVLIDRRSVQVWENRSLPLGEWGQAELDRALAAGEADGSGFATATLQVDEPADTFFALPGSGRGMIWVNDFLLGRYWDIGPQLTSYCPAPLLRAGENIVTVLELERHGGVLELREKAELGPSEEYVEEFD